MAGPNGRDNHITKLAHEMITPLTCMRAYAGLLRDGKIGPISQEQQEVLEIIARNIGRLSLVVSELVNTERGKVTSSEDQGRECQGDPKQP